MSEITKLYENAEVKKQIPKVCSSNELYCKECEAHIGNAMPYCKNAEYPQFTAEKQIKLIKWLVHYIKQINITDVISGEFYFTAFGCVGDMKIDFEEALANLVNKLWQDLAPKEKQQIKEILE